MVYVSYVVAAVPEFTNLALRQTIHFWVGINADDISSLYFACVDRHSSTNWPSNEHGLFVNIPCGTGANIQIVYDEGYAVYIRKQWSGVWSSWKKLH